jgi:hypothetical protein
MRTPRPFLFLRPLVLAVVFLAVVAPEARAQTTAVACDPPCAVGDSCVEGRCYTPATPRPGAAEPAPAPAVPPAPPAASPAPPVVLPLPPPAPSRRPKARRAKPLESDESESDDDVEGIPPRRRGLLAIPFLGIHSIQGLAADDFGVGARVGTLLGVHVDPLVSLNVEAAVDFLNVESKGSTASQTGHDLTIAFSPLFHVAGNAAELVVGPKLGYWSENFTVTDMRVTTRASAWGWAVGGNIGGFANINEHAAIGLLLSYQFIDENQACTHGPLDSDRTCTQASGLFPPEILGITGAALF